MGAKRCLGYIPVSAVERELLALSTGRVSPDDINGNTLYRVYDFPGFCLPVGYTKIFDRDILIDEDHKTWIDMKMLAESMERGVRECVHFDSLKTQVDLYFEGGKLVLFWTLYYCGTEGVDAFLNEHSGRCCRSACKSYADAPKKRDLPAWITAEEVEEGIPGDFFTVPPEELIRLLAKLDSY